MKDKHTLEFVNDDIERVREKRLEIRTQNEIAKNSIKAQTGELAKLEEDIRHVDDQFKKEQNLVSDAKRERDDASNAQVKRDIQIRKLDHELISLRNLCVNGEKEFDRKEMEIQKLQQQIEKDSDKLKKISIIDVSLREKREQIHKMQKDLMQLRAERAAMEEELSIPINIHRWTLLESSDPERFEKLKTYQQLQTELVMKTNEVVKIQGTINQQMEIFNDLQNQLPKTTKEFKGSHADLASSVKKQKGELELITAQLDMYRDIVKEYRKELSDVQTELNHERSKWIREKKKELKNKRAILEQQKILDELNIHLSAPDE